MLTWLATPFIFALGLVIVTWQGIVQLVGRLSSTRRH
jgi:hypothetical protein